MRSVVIPLLAVVVLAAGCGSGGAGGAGGALQGGGTRHVPQAEGPRTSWHAVSPGQSATTVGVPIPEEVVSDPRSVLLDAVVTPRAGGLRVVAWWGCVDRGCRGRRAIATSDDGFATAAYEPWSVRTWMAYADRSIPRVPAVPALAGLLQQPVTSMATGSAEGVQVVVAGGDGATLMPFQVAARSSDHGASWEAYDVDLGDEVGYQSGAVGLPDGRLLVLLDHFGDETLARPAERWHGLWASDGTDWSTYAPYRPAFDPPLATAPGGWSPVVALEAHQDVAWVRTWDSRLYVSTDGATTFQQVPAR